MKGKFTSVILAVVLVAITAGTIFFGYSKASGKITKSGAEEEQRYAWPLATCSTEDTITHIFATQFAKEVEKLSDGKMKINVYPQSTLGGDRELMESCKDGDIPFVVQSPAPQVSFMPQLCVFDTPCLFENIDDARKAIDNPDFQKEIQKIYKGAGYDLLGIADQCFRVMTSAKPFTGIESFKGQKNPYNGERIPSSVLETDGSKPYTNEFLRSIHRTPAGNDRCTGKCLRNYRKCEALRTAEIPDQHECSTGLYNIDCQ